MELGKPTRVGQSPAGLVNRADNRHCFEPSRSELSSVTLTVVSLPRKESLGPVNVPLSGRICFGEPGNGDTNQIAVSHYAIGRIKINPAGARQTRSKVFLDIDSQQIDAHSEIGRNALLEIRRVILILALLLTPAIGGSQTQAPENSGSVEYVQQYSPPPGDPAPAVPPEKPMAATPELALDAPVQNKKDDSRGQQTKRMLWLIPNFAAVNADTQLPPLSTREKFVLAAQDSVVDYSSYTWAGILAGQAMLLNSDPELGRGVKGYGRYYWRTFTDGVSGTFFTEAIVPAITHEDPRYYTMGQGGFFRRTAYAISRAFVTKTDSGGTTFNWSEVAGNGLEAGLSNAYYPPQERGLNQTALNWGTQMESAILNHFFQEFWPDIRKNLFRQK